MILATIRDGQVEELRQLLASMNILPGHADPDNSLVTFSRFLRLHVARFVILELDTADEIREHGMEPTSWRPALAFLGDCDGSSDSFIAELANRAAPGLKEIFSFCEDPPGENNRLLSWMKQHSITPQANYCNWIGRTVKQVHEERALHQSLAACLPKIMEEVGRENTRAIRQKLLSHVALELHGGRLTLSPPDKTPIGWQIKNLIHKTGIPLLLLLLSPFLLLAFPFLAWRLRALESSDPEIVRRPDPEHIEKLSTLEDHDVTNQFNVLGDIKPGLFRMMVLRFGLLLLDYSARHVYNRGFLTRVQTIHFARWVIMPDKKRLYFASNYDGSLESYMDDFINKVAWGLNLVFSNGVGYPATRWLLKGGAEREQEFKYTLRRHQLVSEVWYKAYPGITAFEILRNSRIREGVEKRQPNDAAIREWLD